MENKVTPFIPALVRAISEDAKANRYVDFVISTEAKDTYDTVFKIEGWKLDRYHQNPIVLYNHRSYSDNPNMIIGTSKVWIEGNLLIARCYFESADVNPLAETIYQKVVAGTLRMASVGVNPIRGHWGIFENGENPDVYYFDEHELLEWSIVPVGSNPDALSRSAKLIEDFTKDKPEKQESTTKRSLCERQIQINKNRI